MNTTVPLFDAETARSYLRMIVPEWEWLIAQIESEKGHVRFPRQLADIIRNLKIESYPLLYENEASVGVILARAFMGDEELRDFNREAEAASPQERGELMLRVVRELDELGQAFELPKTPADERRARQAYDALSSAEQTAVVTMWQRLMMGFLATFYQHLSVMVHGEKLTALVKQAKAGNSTAFAKAIQIDKRILTVVPYFRERYALAGIESDSAFLQEVGRRLSIPPYRGKIRHKSLWLTFATLEACGQLTAFGHEALLDLCDEVGVGGRRNRISDVKNLSKRLAEYRLFQKRGFVSTP